MGDLTEFKDNLALIIFVARKSANINHIDLVEKTGITRPILSAIENGSGNPTLDSILKLKSFLKVNDEFLTMSKFRFHSLKTELKTNYSNYLLNNSKLHIAHEDWKHLLKLSDDYIKPSYSKIVKICRRIVETNLNSTDYILIQSATIGASLGVIFQTDGFEDNLNFGFWLGSKFFK
jgi:transcriptional regulator with XRE-family HTH domain